MFDFKGIWILVLVLVNCQLAVSQEHYERLSSLDVVSYEFQIEVNDQNNVIMAEATVDIHFLKALNNFSLDLVSQEANGKGMKVGMVKMNDQTLDFKQKDDQLIIAATVKAEENHTFLIQYQGIPKDGLIIGENKHGDRTFFGDNWPNRAHHWLPTVDHPSDKALVKWTVIAPSHYQVVANGIQIEETNLDKNRKLTSYQTAVPMPTKVMVIGIAPFAVELVREVRDIPVTSWIFPSDREAGFYDYEPAADVLQWFIDHVADYPYAKLANVQSKTRYGGMENAGNIFYSEGSVTGNRTIENLLAHEIAHQWFGNTVSEADWHHVWLSEGFATYFTNLYVEGRHGRDAMEDLLQSQRTRVIRFAEMNPVPVINTKIKDYNQLLNANSYQKGGWILHMLRNEIGDDAFWKGIKAYYHKYKYANALSDDFQKVMEKLSGKELDWFFEQWLYRAGQPVIEIDWSFDEKSKSITLNAQQVQTGEAYKLNLEVAFWDEAKEEIGVYSFNMKEKNQSFTVEELTTTPVYIRLDPNTNLLFKGQLK